MAREQSLSRGEVVRLANISSDGIRQEGAVQIWSWECRELKLESLVSITLLGTIPRCIFFDSPKDKSRDPFGDIIVFGRECGNA